MRYLVIFLGWLAGLAMVVTPAFSQGWQTSGNDVYKLTGSVGIGMEKPNGKLHVDGGAAVSGNGMDILLKAQDAAPRSRDAVDGGNVILQPGKSGGNPDWGGIGNHGKVDVKGEIYVRGNHGFDAEADMATVYLGDRHNYIKSVHGSGVRIGTYGIVGDAITLLAGSGNVGIGMNPDRKLSVNGAIGLKRVDVWDGTDDNDLTWDGYTITREGSSIRYKNNIRPFQEDFRNVLKLGAKQYQMKEGYGDPEKWLFGYIAEELEEVGLAKLVTHDAEGRPDGIKYKKMAIYLNEILKEHDQKIEKLQAENHSLMERIEALEAKVK